MRMTYNLYVDESGDEGDYLDADKKPIVGSSPYFVLGGIIVDESTVQRFEDEYDYMLYYRFHGNPLPEKFKLHYYPLRNNKPPYDQIPIDDREGLEKDVFDIINRLDCTLISASIGLAAHSKYPEPVSPRAYALHLLQERFQYFLEERDSYGTVIYERLNAKMERRIKQAIRRLQKHSNFPKPTDLTRINPRVQNGDPTQQPILNLADFFAYLPYTYRMSGQYSSYYKLIMHKYFNLHGEKFRTGGLDPAKVRPIKTECLRVQEAAAGA